MVQKPVISFPIRKRLFAGIAVAHFLGSMVAQMWIGSRPDLGTIGGVYELPCDLIIDNYGNLLSDRSTAEFIAYSSINALAWAGAAAAIILLFEAQVVRGPQRPFGRLAFHLIAAVSLALFVGFGEGWLESYSRYDSFRIVSDESESFAVGQANGVILVGYGYSEFLFEFKPSFHSSISSSAVGLDGFLYFFLAGDGSSGDPVWRQNLGARCGTGPTRLDTWIVILPYGYALAATTIMPVAWLVWWRRGKWSGTQGLCRRCGYDLRATPDRCPECGTIPQT